MLILVCAIIVAVIYFKFKNYYKSTYYRITKNSIFSVYYDIGKLGEYMTYVKLKKYEKIGGRFLFNVYLPKENGETTEIDVLLITPKGIFVFESKNYSGWIFGSLNSRMWTQSLPSGKGRSEKKQFFNPIMQNQGHINNLKRILGDNIPMYSIITFSERCELKKVPNNTDELKIVNRNNVLLAVNKIYSQKEECIDTSKIYEIYAKLFNYSQVDEDTKKEHVKNIKEKMRG